MIRNLGFVLFGGLLAGTAFGQSYLFLKTRTVDPVAADGAGASRTRQRAAQRLTSTGERHLIVQFESMPGSEERQELERRGARVLDYVPENALLVIAPEDLNLDGLAVRWSGPMRAEDKVSPQIGQTATFAALQDAGEFVVAFHKDVSIESARVLISSLGIVLRDNPDLAPDHLLIRATADGVMALSNWDEVAYVFPASDELTAGRPTVACAGAVTTAGTVGQYTARVGEGWDGPGLGAAQINYVFGQMTAQLPVDAARAEIVRALGEWSRVAKVTFSPGSSGTAARTINVLFGAGAHGDSYPFDGPGNVLAHTFYPAPPNPEPIAGDMHLDDAEHWRVGSDIDLYSVALHELGHALGLGHSDVPGAVMYPYYRQATSLTAEDIGAIQMLYAAAGAGDPLALSVDAPASPTTSASVTVTGTISGGASPVAVRWTSDRGMSGAATGSTPWSAAVTLQTGINNIVFTATDAQQRTASQAMNITRSDTTAPVSLAITGPTSAATFTTASSSLILSGTAADASGIRQVTWANSRGGSGIASGTTAWSAGPLALATGATTFTIRATAVSGAFAEKTLTVTYQAPSTPPAPTPPSITILSPASTYFYTSASAITFSGTASDNVGVKTVTWSTNTGKSGTATGTTGWTAAIPMVSGANYVKIQAADAAGNLGWRTVVVVKY
ncbi:MAG: matrixin family metalloprotease [Bryobacteraceae bacterium]